MQILSRSLLLSSLLAGSAFGQCFSVTTMTISGNGQSGTMFDVVNISALPINIGSFDQCFFSAGTSALIEIYTKAGTWNGFQQTPAAWTLVGSTPNFAHGIAPTLDPLPIAVNVTIPPGGTQGFYITGDVGTTVAYTTGATGQLGSVIGSNADMQVTAGVGVPYPFGAPFGLPNAGRLWNGRVNYCPLGGGTVLATNTALGTGCVSRFASFYENFATSPAFDLSNTVMSMIPTGSGYIVIPGGGAFLPVGSVQATPTIVANADDIEQTVPFTVGSFPGWTGVTVCSNGFVSKATGNGTSFTPTAAAMLAGPQDWFSLCWHDYNPSIVGSGQIKYEESASVTMVTWDGVWDFGGASASNANTMQIQLYPSGIVTIAYGTTSTLGGGRLVGYSPGGASLDPGNTDISTTLGAGSITLSSPDVLPLTLAATSRPVTGTNWNLNVTNVPATGVIGVDIFGLSDPAIPDLGFLGAPGCGLRASLDLLNAWLVAGSSHGYSFAVPNNPALVNVHLYTMSAVFQNPPVNAFGAITSNGIDGKIGDF